MSGTIDQVEAIFEGVTSIWGRVLVFFIVSWLAFTCGILIASTEWTLDGGFLMMYLMRDWYFVPISWMAKSFTAALHWWGLLRLLFLVVIAFLLFFTEANLCRLVCLLVVEELWFWWGQASIAPYFENGIGNGIREVCDYYFDFDDWHIWHPFSALLVPFTIFAGWIWWQSWQKDHPSVYTP